MEQKILTEQNSSHSSGGTLVLIPVGLGNDGDPVTPLRSAKSVASALGDSAVLIEQDSFGHSSLAMHSKW
ncbi:hypothetical protein FRC12_015885 [Ceratobasidium sp. 428]|nr:hypothetical protein FRC12_015885 [Ceratobasidium sp. 428]